MAQIFAFLTATRVKYEDDATAVAEAFGVSVDELRADAGTDYNPATDTVRVEDAVEEHGWVDRSWNPRTLYDSRNDVRPVVSEDERDTEELTEAVRDALEWLPGGYEDNGDGTFYASDSESPMDEPWDYTYALHFVRKTAPHEHGGTNPLDWRESPWVPPMDMRP